MVNGIAFDKAALTGKVVFVEEWGVNCGPCIASLPEMAEMAKFGEKKTSSLWGASAKNSSKDAILKVLKTSKVGCPVMAGGSAPGNIGSIPLACVSDVTGKLIFRGHPANSEFEKAVKEAMRDAKAEPKV